MALNLKLLDSGCAGLAHHLVLRTRTTRAADCTDQLSAFDQRDPAARGNHAVERESVVVLLQLYAILESSRFAPKAGGGARFMFCNGNRSELRAVHALEGH